MTVTFVSATTGSATETKRRTSGESLAAGEPGTGAGAADIEDAGDVPCAVSDVSLLATIGDNASDANASNVVRRIFKFLIGP